MKTIFGRKSFSAIKTILKVRMERMMSGAVFSLNKRLSRYRRHLRGRSQPDCAVLYGIGLARRSCFSQKKTLQGTRYLPDVGASLESGNDRIGDVAVIPAASESIAV